jgi:hypothetical protein
MAFCENKVRFFFKQGTMHHIYYLSLNSSKSMFYLCHCECANTHTHTHNVTAIKSTTTSHALYYENGTCMWYSWQNVFLQY